MPESKSIYFSFEIEKDVCQPLNFLGDHILMRILEQQLQKKDLMLQDMYKKLLSENQKSELYLSFIKNKGLKKSLDAFVKKNQAESK